MNNELQFSNLQIEEVNKEIQSIKDIIKNLKSLLSRQFNDLFYQINNNQKVLEDKSKDRNNNLIKEISFNFFYNKKRAFYSEIKSVKTIQPHKIKNYNSYNILRSNSKSQKVKSRFNSTKNNLPKINNKEEFENQNRSHSSTYLYFYGSDINLYEKQMKDNLIIDTKKKEKLIKILLKIKDIYEYMKLIPDIVKEKIEADNFENMLKLKEKFMKNIDEKLKNIFSHKLCEECEKIEYFYGFTKCLCCSNIRCKNCILLCPNCKNFICKNCYKKNHQCDKVMAN